MFASGFTNTNAQKPPAESKHVMLCIDLTPVSPPYNGRKGLAPDAAPVLTAELLINPVFAMFVKNEAILPATPA